MTLEMTEHIISDFFSKNKIYNGDEIYQNFKFWIGGQEQAQKKCEKPPQQYVKLFLMLK